MKKFTFKGVLDGFRSSTVQQPPRGAEQEIQETLRPDHFQLKKTFRHGFPFSPTAIAWDPIQKLLAVGDKSGSLRILGRPGVDAHVRHECGPLGTGEAVLHIQFLVNEGALVTATADDVLHLWNFRQKSPQVVQSLKFQRERITCLHLPLQSKWLHVGTERGNVHVVHIETFVLSGYIINWNKAIEPSRSTHPGPVVQITDNPFDASKLLIAFESGQMVVWDLRSKSAEYRCIGAESLRSVAWHQEGKQFLSSHGDGSLATWAVRGPPKPLVVSYPHAKPNKDGKLETCKPIQKVEWKTNKAGETLVIFSGGLPADKTGKTPSITVINGKSTTVLEIEHSVVDFITLCDSPWTGDYQDPFAIVVLLQNDLVVIDLLTQGYPCFENPYPMDIHESPVTCCSYLADCPSDLIPAFYSVGRQCGQKKAGFSEKEWPVNGGEWSPASCSYNEIILTGHADGSVKFWDASAGTLQILYKLKTSKVFERRPSSSVDTNMDDSPLAVQLLSLCAESRRLAVACTASHVTLFKFRKADTTSETHVLDIPVICQDDTENSPDSEYPPVSRGSISSRAIGCQDSIDSQDRRTQGSGDLRVRGAQGTGGVRKAAGFQAALVCLQQSPSSAGNISALTINSSYGLMAYGGERGVVVVDISRRVLVAAVAAAALYGGADPFGRTGGGGAGAGGAMAGVGALSGSGAGALSGGGALGGRRDTDASQHQRSPSIDQMNGACGACGGGGCAACGGGGAAAFSSAGRRSRSQDKLDSSFSRSRSSSMSSLENISSEAIQCLAFADSYTKKSDPTLLLPTLWIGTSLGSVLTMMINLPDADSRYTHPVVISVSGGPIFRLKGSILAMSFLDCNGALIPYSYESWKDENKELRDRRERTPTKQSSSSRMSPTLSTDASSGTGQGNSSSGIGCGDRQFVVIASEKQARVVALPSQNCVYRQQIADSDFVVKAEIVSLKDSVCLVNYVSTGHVIAYSLPSLRPLIDVEFLPLGELRIARTFCFSNRGHGLYLSSPTELQKFTIDAEFCQSLGEMMGELFLPRDMPEPPKESFFRGLFGGGSRPLDREELFGEGSGKPLRSIAKHIPPGGQAAVEQLNTRASSATSEIQRAHHMVLERGDKLSQLEDRTERMHSQAQEFGSSAHQLMLKYKDKKWYQL